MSEKPRHNPNGMMRRLGDYRPGDFVEIHTLRANPVLNLAVETVQIEEVRDNSVLLCNDGRSLSPETAVLPRWPVRRRVRDRKLFEGEGGFFT